MSLQVARSTKLHRELDLLHRRSALGRRLEEPDARRSARASGRLSRAGDDGTSWTPQLATPGVPRARCVTTMAVEECDDAPQRSAEPLLSGPAPDVEAVVRALRRRRRSAGRPLTRFAWSAVAACSGTH